MKELLRKYRSDTLTPAELQRLRQMLAHTPDEALAPLLYTDFDRHTPAEMPADVKARILNRILNPAATRRRTTLLQWAAGIAALIAIALTTTLLTTTPHTGSDTQFSITTPPGQTARVSLPDGSAVHLGPASTLTSTSNRSIDFSGQGYFEITTDPGHPFSITTAGMTVTVTGTEFNIDTNTNPAQSQVYLLKGSVQLTCSTGTANLQPGQIATLTDGHLSVAEATAADANLLGWHTGVLTFDQTPLAHVLTTLGQHYHCNIDTTALPRRNFSGTIPADNLNVALGTIELVYGITLTAQ